VRCAIGLCKATIVKVAVSCAAGKLDHAEMLLELGSFAEARDRGGGEMRPSQDFS